MNKLIAVTLLTLSLSSCGSTSKEINMTIINSDIEVDLPCDHRTKRVTLFRSDDGKIAKKCGYWGEIGDNINGYWISGKYEWREGIKNGFQFSK